MRRATRLLAVLIVLTAPGFPGAASAESGETLAWSGEVVLDGAFVVPADTTLVVAANATIRPTARDGDFSGLLVVEGRLLVEGTREAPARFLAPVTLRGADTAGSVIRHAIFDDVAGTVHPEHECALTSRDAVFRVESSRFTNNSRAACVHGGSTAFVGNAFLYNGFLDGRGEPLEVEAYPCRDDDGRVRTGPEPGATHPPEDGAVYSVCPPPGAGSRGAPGELHRCWVTWRGSEYCRGATGGTLPSLHVSEGGTVLVEGNRFAASFGGVFLGDGTSAVVRGNAFTDHVHEGLVFGTAPGDGPRTVAVEDNRFHGHGRPDDDDVAATMRAVALLVRGWHEGHDPGDAFLVRDNVFTGNALAVRVAGDASNVRFGNNTVTGNAVGYHGDAATVTFRDSRFENARLDLYLGGFRNHVRLPNTTFDAEKVYMGEGNVVIEHDDGVLRRVTHRFTGVTYVIAASGVTLVALAVVTEAGRWTLGKGVVAVAYTRLTRSRLLAHGTRQRLLARISEDPGAHLRALARDAGSYGAAVYHLSRMEKAGLVRSARDGVRRRFYPAEARTPESTDLAPFARRLVHLTRERPGLTLSEAARCLGCSRQVVHYHAHALATRGVLTLGDAPGGARTLNPAPPAREGT